jgi:RNA 3'-terminal phosphate cyclase (ATP)
MDAASMITVDGAQKSGSGTIVRYAVALAALRGRPVRVVNARARRRSPGLRHQHVTSILAAAALSGATAEGVAVGSQTFTFTPGPTLAGGRYDWDIGTAGSTTMLVLSILPMACFADRPVRARITGGVVQDFAPSPFHMQHALAPLLKRMGVDITLAIVRPGYVPTGAGVIEVTVTPSRRRLRALALDDPGIVSEVRGVALSSHLEERRVSDRMASTCEENLRTGGLACNIERVYDQTAPHAGACLAVWSESSTGCRFGADRAGRYGRSSEAIGRYVAASFLEDVRQGATVDQFLADQLVLFAALAEGTSSYVTPRRTMHLESNLWLIGLFGAHSRMEDRRVTIEGLATTR